MIVIFGGPMSRIERVALVTGWVLVAVLMWPVRNAVSDTTFAWLNVARHLAQGSGLVFNPGERVYATTNPLWVALLADGMAIGLDGLTLARVLGVIATLVSVPLFLQLLRRTVRTPALRAVGTVAWASQAWMARWSMSGLETPLAVALVLGGFVALTEGADWGDRPVRTGALWSLAALTRPGAVLLLVLWATALLIDAQSRPGLRRLVFGMLPVVAIYGSWLLFARFYFGELWPSSLATSPDVNVTLAEWWHRFTVDFGRVSGTEGAVVVAGVIALILGGPPARRHDRSALRLLPLAWVLLLPSLFAARGLEAAARQLLVVIPVVHWLVWWAVDRWVGGDRPSPAQTRAAVIGTALAVIVVVQNLETYRHRVLPEVDAEQAGMERSLIRWGRWLKAEAPSGTLVASDAPGALAYFGDVRIMDLGGRFTPQMAALRRQARLRDVVANLSFSDFGHPAYIVDRSQSSASLHLTSPYSSAFRELDEAWGFAIYRVDWSAVHEEEARVK